MLRDERDFLIFKGEVERAERRWRELDQDERALLTGLDLTRAEEWLPTRGQDLSTVVIAFIQQSIAVDRAAKERQLAEKERQIRFQRRVTVGAVAAALVMLVIGSFAWVQWGEANRSAAEKARAEEMALRQLRKAQLNQSLFLVGVSGEQRAAGDAGTALLLALTLVGRAAVTGRARCRMHGWGEGRAVRRATATAISSMGFGPAKT